MQSHSVILAANVNAATDQAAGYLPVGGKCVLVIEATTYPTTVELQVQAPSSKWVKINTSNISADGGYPYDVPAGQVRMHLTGGTSTALYATLIKIPY